MLQNYIKISLRNFWKNRSYSLINLGGLGIGIASCLLISLYVLQELSYDKFHPYSENTYRVVMDMYGGKELKTKSAVIFPAVGHALKEEFPEVIEFTRILPFGDGVYSRKGGNGELLRYNETKAVYADETFFQLLGFNLLKGDVAQVLAEKNQIVLSESAARKYFGDKDPIGETLTYRGEEQLTVTGIMEDFPKHSHMQFDMITSLKSIGSYERFPENWGWYDFYTFIRLDPAANVKAFEEKIAGLLDIKKADTYARNQSREVLWLQNVGDVHLYSANLSWDMGQNGGAYQVYFLGAVALLILMIAWINFVNLSTARAVKRAKEVGVRKVVGAQRRQLLYQFLTEALVYNVLGVLAALFLLSFILPLANQMLGSTLSLQALFSGKIILALSGLILIGALISGLYPAYVLSSFQPLSVIKGRFYERKKAFGFRQVLVVFQFAASIVLILGTFMVVKQLHFMQNHDLGLNMEQTLVLRAPTSSNGDGDLPNRLGLFRNTLDDIPAVKGMTISSAIPGIENFGISGFRSKHFLEEARDCYRVSIDENFIKDFEIGLLAGRNFSSEMRSDSNGVLLNERALNHLGFTSAEEAIGEKVNPGSERWERIIVGVVENYHQASVKEDLDPVVFFYNERWGNYYSIKLESNNFKETMAAVEGQWNKIYPDNPFDYFFLDESFALQYEADTRFNKVFIGFAILAILVACLGLFGLVSYTTEQSQKEIGIRKVLGASVSQVIFFLASDYAKLILIAMVVAFPLGYYLIKRWLENFALHTTIGVEMFLLTAGLIALIAIITMSLKSYRAATTNPVNVLRSE